MKTLRARCMELIQDNPAFTRADVEALVRAFDEERGRQKEVTDQRVAELVYLAQAQMGLPRRLPWRYTTTPRRPVAKPRVVVRRPKAPKAKTPKAPRPPRVKPDPKDAAQHYGLVHMVIRRYRRHVRGRIELDDLVQEGLLGVVRAQETWDPAKGSFATHAFFWIRQRVLRYIDGAARCVRIPSYVKDKPSERLVWLDATCIGEGSPQHERVGKHDPALEHGLTRLEVRRLLALIPDERRRSIVTAHHVGGMTLAQVGDTLGVTRERARQLDSEGLDYIRRHLRRMERLRGAA